MTLKCFGHSEHVLYGPQTIAGKLLLGAGMAN